MPPYLEGEEKVPTPPFMPIDRGWTESRYFGNSMSFHGIVTLITTLLPFSL